jgi:hypothetical protein
MSWQDAAWTIVLAAPCVGVLAVGVLALLHEEVVKSRHLGPLQLQRVVRRADSGLLTDYLTNGAGTPSTPSARTSPLAASMVRRADPELLQDHLAERRKARRPFRRRVAPVPRSRPARPPHLVPLSA